MKWLFWIIFILAALVGGVLGLAYYVLPPTAAVARSVEVARPASMVYPLLTNLRTFNEFSPWYERDPKAEYAFGGPAFGVGQSASWVSTVPEIGSGEITIVKLIENKEVDTRIELGAGPIPFLTPPRVVATYTLEPRGVGARVTWSTRATCPSRPTATPCRIATKIALLELGRQFDIGLAKLKTLAEQLPALDIADLKLERVSVAPQDFAYREAGAPADQEQFRAALRQAFAVTQYLAKNGVSAAGAPMGVMVRDASGAAVLRAGAPFAGPAPLLPDGVRVGKTPSGLALKTLYVGDYANMRPVYAKLDGYRRAYRLDSAGEPWEVYLDDPDKTDPAQLRTEIYLPVK